MIVLLSFPKKKKWKKANNKSEPKSNHPDNSINQINVGLEPVLTISHKLTKEGEVSNNPLVTDEVWKLPTKIFQEIGEDYVFEVIPTAPVPSCSKIGPSMEVDSFVEVEDDLTYGASDTRRRGRPPGSKNKLLGARQGDTSNRFLALTEHDYMADSSLNNVSQ